MQYPVPQFTDVEDKIIGPLTLKQFGILAFAGGMVFLVYSGTKNLVVTIIMLLLLGLPAVFIAFAKINGRPFYNFFSAFVKFILVPKMMVFDKQGSTEPIFAQPKEEKTELAPLNTKKTSIELKRLNYVLQQQAQAESQIIRNKLSS